MATKVLLVDDSPTVIDSVKLVLSDEGYTVYSANSVAEARGLLEQGLVVDMVISDQEMPGGASGTDLLGWLRTERPDVLRFMLTGHPDYKTMFSAIDKGAVAYFFTKP